MNVKNIKLGKCYLARFSQVEMPVRLEKNALDGGWIARSLTHGRRVKVKDASRLVEPYGRDSVQDIATETTPNRRSRIKGTVHKPPTAPVSNTEVSLALRKPKRPPVKQIVIVTRLNLLDATHRVLSETKKAMSTREIVAACAEKQYWTSSAATPWQTLTAALNRDIAANGAESRFQKKERGRFSLR